MQFNVMKASSWGVLIGITLIHLFLAVPALAQEIAQDSEAIAIAQDEMLRAEEQNLFDEPIDLEEAWDPEETEDSKELQLLDPQADDVLLSDLLTEEVFSEAEGAWEASDVTSGEDAQDLNSIDSVDSMDSVDYADSIDSSDPLIEDEDAPSAATLEPLWPLDEAVPGELVDVFPETFSPEVEVGDAQNAWTYVPSGGRRGAKNALAYNVTAEYYGNQIYSDIYAARIYRQMQSGAWSGASGDTAYIQAYTVQTTVVSSLSMSAYSTQAADAFYNRIREQAIYGGGNAVDAFIYDYPLEAFWMKWYGIGCSGQGYYDKDSHTYYLAVKVHTSVYERWAGAYTQLAALRQYVSAAATQISSVSGFASMSVPEKWKAIHDYICSLVTYGDSTTDNVIQIEHTPLGAFLGGKVVCEGYAKLFKIFSDQLGLPVTILVSGTGYNSETSYGPHMWNEVYLNGVWYLVDVTWDDQSTYEVVFYNYFLAGSGTAGYSSSDGTVMTVGWQHAAANRWSSGDGFSFAVPSLTGAMYHQKKYVSSADDGMTDVLCGLHPLLVDADAEEALEVITKSTQDAKEEQTKESESTALQEKADAQEAAAAQTTRETQEQQRETAQSSLQALFDTAKLKQEAGESSSSSSGTSGQTTSTEKPFITLNVSAGATVPLKTGQTSKKVKVLKMLSGDSIVKVTSSKKAVVAVSKSGKTIILKAKKKTGTARITVTTRKTSVSFKVKVQKGKVKTKKLSVSPGSVRVKKGKKVSLSVSLSPITSAEKITYKIASPKIASVSSKGVVKGKKKGSTKLRIRAGSVSKTIKVVVY